MNIIKTILTISLLSSTIFAEQFTVKYNDLQSIDKMICLGNKLHVMVEIDDVEQPLQIFRITGGPRDENFEEVPCGLNGLDRKIKTKETKNEEK